MPTYIYLVIKMKHHLNYCKEDPNYILLGKIFKIIGSRKAKTIMASKDVKNVNSILINTKPLKRRGKLTFIVDATPVDLDYNVKRKHRSKKHLQKQDLKWSYSSSYGFYIGFKATIVIEQKSAMPVAIIIHSGAPHDSRIFTEILENLQKISKW